MLANLYNIWKDNPGLQRFSFSNADEHYRIAKAIQKQYNVILPDYILDPINTEDPATWLNVHQNVHNLQNSVLGIAGNDISDVDFSKPDQVASWIWLHAQEHLQANLKLGIG